MAQQNIKTPRSGYAVASFLLGLFSFIPLMGLFSGVAAIILGFMAKKQIKEGKYSGKKLSTAGIVLGALGILFTFILYGSLFYYGFVAKTGPFADLQPQLDRRVLTQNAGALELYKRKNGKYPESLNQLMQEGYTVYLTDGRLRPYRYTPSPDGNSYGLVSQIPGYTRNQK